ncbi:hypothetical protein ABIB95_008742 [Bradyrhizobium sp. LA2.1]
MEKKDIEELKNRVACAAVLEKAGFAIDLKESTRKAIKFRRGGDIIIVIHNGKGWFDALSDAKGDVFSLVEHLDGLAFAEVQQRVSDLVGFVPTQPVWTRESRARDPDLTAADRWRVRRKPWPGSLTWRYLCAERGIPEAIIRAAIRHDRLREGPHGSMWAAHLDIDGVVTGWEERGPQWRGFTSWRRQGALRFRAGKCEPALHHRGCDRRHELGRDRRPAAGQSLSQHRRRLGAGHGRCHSSTERAAGRAARRGDR